MTALARVACAIGAIAALGLAFTTHMAVYMIGFPDGHVTDYGKAVRSPLEFLAWTEAGLGFLFLALAVSPISNRVRVFGLLVAAVSVISTALIASVGIPWYFGAHLGLDNGIGG